MAHEDLTAPDIERLRSLFDDEYLDEHGPWSPDSPYGYAPAAIHVMAFAGDDLLGHVGYQPRHITVGARRVLVAGTGGVLVSPAARATGLGRQLMLHAQQHMRETERAEFGYLGCRPSVVGFYEASGWHRVEARERHQSRHDSSTQIETADSPILICSAERSVAEWPQGTIDLNGLPW